jgi:hypothetical protein
VNYTPFTRIQNKSILGTLSKVGGIYDMFDIDQLFINSIKFISTAGREKIY